MRCLCQHDTCGEYCQTCCDGYATDEKGDCTAVELHANRTSPLMPKSLEMEQNSSASDRSPMTAKAEALEKKRTLVMLGTGNDTNVADDRIKNAGTSKGGDALPTKSSDRKEGSVSVVFSNEDVESPNQTDDKVDDLLTPVENSSTPRPQVPATSSIAGARSNGLNTSQIMTTSTGYSVNKQFTESTNPGLENSTVSITEKSMLDVLTVENVTSSTSRTYRSAPSTTDSSTMTWNVTTTETTVSKQQDADDFKELSHEKLNGYLNPTISQHKASNGFDIEEKPTSSSTVQNTSMNPMSGSSAVDTVSTEAIPSIRATDKPKSTETSDNHDQEVETSVGKVVDKSTLVVSTTKSTMIPSKTLALDASTTNGSITTSTQKPMDESSTRILTSSVERKQKTATLRPVDESTTSKTAGSTEIRKPVSEFALRRITTPAATEKIKQESIANKLTTQTKGVEEPVADSTNIKTPATTQNRIDESLNRKFGNTSSTTNRGSSTKEITSASTEEAITAAVAPTARQTRSKGSTTTTKLKSEDEPANRLTTQYTMMTSETNSNEKSIDRGATTAMKTTRLVSTTRQPTTARALPSDKSSTAEPATHADLHPRTDMEGTEEATGVNPVDDSTINKDKTHSVKPVGKSATGSKSLRVTTKPTKEFSATMGSNINNDKANNDNNKSTTSLVKSSPDPDTQKMIITGTQGTTLYSSTVEARPTQESKVATSGKVAESSTTLKTTTGEGILEEVTEKTTAKETGTLGPNNAEATLVKETTKSSFKSSFTDAKRGFTSTDTATLPSTVISTTKAVSRHVGTGESSTQATNTETTADPLPPLLETVAASKESTTVESRLQTNNKSTRVKTTSTTQFMKTTTEPFPPLVDMSESSSVASVTKTTFLNTPKTTTNPTWAASNPTRTTVQFTTEATTVQKISPKGIEKSSIAKTTTEPFPPLVDNTTEVFFLPVGTTSKPFPTHPKTSVKRKTLKTITEQSIVKTTTEPFPPLVDTTNEPFPLPVKTATKSSPPLVETTVGTTQTAAKHTIVKTTAISSTPKGGKKIACCMISYFMIA